MASSQKAVVAAALDRHGQTYAEEAGIRLEDKPAPLFQLLVLALLLSARISADIAMAAARELFAAGYRTPRRMCDASWQDRVDALGRGHYRRYDERTATMLGETSELLLDRWRGDLRRLHAEAQGDTDRLRQLLCEFKGMGPAGSDIFLREVQAVWPDVAPYLDRRVSDGARRLGLPTDTRAVARLVDGPEELARLAAALVRVSLRKDVAEEIRQAAG
jgi:endonuclease III